MAQTGKRLEKIKVTDEEVEIHYSVPKKGDIRDLVSVKSEDRPIPQFRMALQAFDQYVRRLCEWPETVKGEDSGISVSIVHISYNDKGVRSIIVTAKKELAGSNGPFCFNTPLVTEEEDSKYFDSETS